MPRWTCPECKQTWPAYTTVEAYHQHRIAQAAHPGEQCNDFVPFEVSGIRSTRKKD